MPTPRVNVETTIPSMYHEVRSAPDIVARRDWTRQWWAVAPAHYELVTSLAVLDELSGGLPERSAERLVLVRELPLLPIDSSVVEIVQAYVADRLMPSDPGGDELHLALASYHKGDFLLLGGGHEREDSSE